MASELIESCNEICMKYSYFFEDGVPAKSAANLRDGEGAVHSRVRAIAVRAVAME